ncbi:CLUMA_CG003761, isoform A, partial [Clunio marinus]
ISVCDDYSLPFDFIKKRPSSFDPGLAECLPNNWPSPSSEHVTFLDQHQQHQHFLLQQSALQIEFPQHQQQHFEIPSRHLEEPQAPQGYIDESGNLCLLQTAERVDRPNKQSSSRHGTREKTRPSQKRRKKKRVRQQTKKEFDSSVPNSSENEDERIPFNEGKVPELNSPDSINDDVLNRLEAFKSPRRLQTSERCKTSPSPYYYSDLLHKKTTEDELQVERAQLFAKHTKTVVDSIKNKELAFKERKSNSLDNPAADKVVTPPKRYSITEEGVRIIRCDSPSTTTSDDSDCSECQKRREWHSHALAVVRAATQNLRTQTSNDVEPEVYYQNSLVSQMPQNRFLDHPVICACAPNYVDDGDDQLFQPRSIFYVHQQGFQGCADCNITSDDRLKALIFDEMNVRQRKLYETAFDSKIAKSDDDLDEVDRITNHSVSLFGNEYRMVTSQSKDSFISHKEKRYRSKHNKKLQNNNNNKQNVEAEETTLINEIEKIKIEESIDNIVNANVPALPATNTAAYTPSPPSTAPLPLKFPTKHEKFFINSIKSAPNLPASNALQHPRLKDLRGSEKSDAGKERPRSVIIEAGRVFELKRSHSGRNYSSTESMATSSSGGSMESIRSSTSEGNRSTTSTESRHSSSLSSHSSDSGPSVVRPLRAPIIIHPKLQILSPISDKSAQEPVSENGENMKIQSPKQTPDENSEKIIEDNIDKDNVKQKKRPTSKTLLLIGRDEIQGSDSGISLHSRDEKGKLSALCDNKVDNATGLPQDLKDLPFDMPKLRRRRILLNQSSGGSGSATSVDLGDLPFDMPKLRRRMRVGGVNLILPANISNNSTTNALTTNNINNTINNNLSTDTSGVSQASSSQSVQDDRPIMGGGVFRQNLTLNLNDTKSAKTKKPFGTLDLHGLTDTGNLSARSSGGISFNAGGFNRLNMALIDDTIPLERQGWYHGAITRIDAENVLRQLSEGSFLVRNSESAKQDYSLSLKSAKGFMHMRIQQQNDSGEYILGQFSRPFKSIPEMIRHFCLNRLPVRGAEHMCLLEPVIAQLL